MRPLTSRHTHPQMKQMHDKISPRPDMASPAPRAVPGLAAHQGAGTGEAV